MLKLERMEISGFKSFGDRTEVRFPAGVTAVVGPNGCGKSNIGDAINWVLGEQSAKMLRGKQMTDVIFAGSEARKPVGLAEVSLIFAGAEGFEKAADGRIVVTRRLHRTGESDYLLNKKRTRLKDIQELLREAKVGARTYATIEQGHIERILNAKPKERRVLIEDAAGVSGFKHKRRLTELKLEATEANLLRVNDIVLEVERQIRSLKRQASRARRYRRLRDELRAKESIRFGLRARTMDAELQTLRSTETGVRDAEAAAAAELGRLEAELEVLRGTADETAQAFREASERAHALDIEIDREEGQIRASKERTVESRENAAKLKEEAERLESRRDEAVQQSCLHQSQVEEAAAIFRRLDEQATTRQQAQARNEAAQRELGETIEQLRRGLFDSMNRAVEFRNQLRNHEEALQRNTGQRARLEAERTSSSDALDQLTTEFDSLAREKQTHAARLDELTRLHEETDAGLVLARQRHSRTVEQLAAVRERLKSAQARIDTLADVETRFAGVSDGVRTLLHSGASAGVRNLGVVADFIDAGAEVESAAEGFLDLFLPTVILEDDADACRASELLRASGAGRTTLLPKTQPAGGTAVGAGRNGAGEIPAILSKHPGVRGRLREQLTLNTAANGVIQDRVGDAILVDDLRTALDLHRLHPSSDYLTPEGDVVFASGVVRTGGHSSSDKGLLAHRRRLEGARTDAVEAAQQEVELKERVEGERRQVVDLEILLREQRQSREEAVQRHAELEMQHRRSAEETERTGRRTEVLMAELAAAAEEEQQLKQAIASRVAEVEGAEEAHRTLELDLHSRLAEHERHVDEIRREADETARRLAELAVSRERRETLERESVRLREIAAELEQRVAGLLRQSESDAERSTEAQRLAEETEARLLTHLEERKGVGAQAAELERGIQEQRERLTELEGSLRQSRQALETVREQRREAELTRTRAEADRAHLDELCSQELGVGVEEAADAAGEALEGVDLAALEEEVAGIKDKIERIGPVNMTAIEEFSELEERHGFLTSQRTDLQESMSALRETIRKINRQSRDRFAKAFEEIRVSFQEIFKLLFSGGRADLRLEEGEDLLESGVEILVQPPGKRLGSIQLMSGGEKSMSAIALLFAIFRYQPSPFCLLDEVDAALDDTNVVRFTRMLGEYAQNTQFIIVTHNKLTMETADLIYGVTMEEPGVSKIMSLQLQ